MVTYRSCFLEPIRWVLADQRRVRNRGRTLRQTNQQAVKESAFYWVPFVPSARLFC